MSAQNIETPISDSTPHTVGDLAAVCRRLERKLAATRHYLSVVSERVKRLEEAGESVDDAIMSVQDWQDTRVGDCLDAWRKAKETKP